VHGTCGGEVRLSAKFHVGLNVLTRIGGAGLAACSAIVLAHVVGAEGIGLFALLRALPAILVMVTELGVAASGPYLINKRKFDANEVAGNAVLFGLIVGIVQIVLWCATHRLIGDYVLRGLPSEWILAAALLAPIEIQLIEQQGIFRSLQRFWTTNLLHIGLEACLLLCFITAAAFEALTISSLVPCVLLANFVILFLSSLCLVMLDVSPTWRLNIDLLRLSIRFGIRAQLSAALQYLNYRLDHLILGIIAGPEVVGLYFVATRAAEMFRYLPVSVGFVIAPRLASRSRQSAIATVQRYALPIFLLNLSAMVVAAAIGPYLFPIFFDDWSRDAVIPFWILLAGLTAVGANGAFSGFNDAQGMPELNLYANLMGLIVTVALDLTLIPLYDQIGAAVASSASYIVIGASLAFFFRRAVRTGVKISSSQFT
jgi:O-antigen/teichoic acid export membrane protein